jgi:phage shock protein PspC (stress-responsive transcriptional regulator)
MQTVMQVSLSGHASAFQLDEDAFRALQSYLDRARSRLRRDPDRDEILADLEQSIGVKLRARLNGEARVITRRDVDAVLEQVGTVEPGNGDANSGTASSAPFGRPRRLCRIEEGKWLTGVCEGLSAYASIRVDWVRALFVIVTVFTGGIPILIYLVLMFALPVVQTHAEYEASLHTPSGAV